MKEDDIYCTIPEGLILKYGDQFPCDVYLKFADSRVVKISHKDENITTVYQKYKTKGIKEIFVKKDQFLEFMAEIKNKMSGKFFDPKTQNLDEMVHFLNDGHKMVKEALSKFGVKKATIEMAKEVGGQSMRLMQSVPNVFSFFKQFKESCSSEFLISMLTGYTSSCMIQTFSWQTSAIKEKANLAAFLCDIVLTKEDFKELERSKDEPDLLPRHIYDHPKIVIEKLAPEKKVISSETLSIIEQHHERPDGKGFPGGLKHDKITLLSSIHIVSADFVHSMIQHKFDFSKKDYILNDLEFKYNKANFKKAVESLKVMLGGKPKGF